MLFETVTHWRTLKFLCYFPLFLQQEFDQYRHDVDQLIEEKNKLGESFLSLQQSWKSKILSGGGFISHGQYSC